MTTTDHTVQTFEHGAQRRTSESRDDDRNRGGSGDQEAESYKWKYGVNVVMAGLVIIFASFAIALVEYSQAADVSTAMAPITGVVGAIVGAYFGIRAGAAGKDKVERHRKDADDDVKKLCLRTPPGECEGMDLSFNRCTPTSAPS